jgi:hypothetical protein
MRPTVAFHEIQQRGCGQTIRMPIVFNSMDAYKIRSRSNQNVNLTNGMGKNPC